MIPAVGILMARRLENHQTNSSRLNLKISAALLASAAVSIGVTYADASLANTGRVSAQIMYAESRDAAAPLYFEGHWGFQYYLQNLGAKPADVRHSSFHAGDLLAIPENTTNSFGPPPGFRLEGRLLQFEPEGPIATMSQPLGAGFYASVWGPLPFGAGKVPPERYFLARLVPLTRSNDPFASLPQH
jgi:hypothetical protein